MKNLQSHKENQSNLWNIHNYKPMKTNIKLWIKMSHVSRKFFQKKKKYLSVILRLLTHIIAKLKKSELTCKWDTKNIEMGETQIKQSKC